MNSVNEKSFAKDIVSNFISKIKKVDPVGDMVICFAALLASMIYSFEWKERFAGVQTLWLIRLVLTLLVCGFFVAAAVRNGLAKQRSFGIFMAVVFWAPQLCWILASVTDAPIYSSDFHAMFNVICSGIADLIRGGFDSLASVPASMGIPSAVTINLFCVVTMGIYLYLYAVSSNRSGVSEKTKNSQRYC